MSPEEYENYIGPFDAYDPTEKQVDWWHGEGCRHSTKFIGIDIAKCENCERVFPVFSDEKDVTCSCGCTRFTYGPDTIEIEVTIDREEGRCYIDDGDNLC